MPREIHTELIQEYIKLKSNRIFSNSNRDLFKVLLNSIFENANEINWGVANLDKIKFFLNEGGFESIIKFLQKNKTLKLITSNGNECLISKLNELSSEYKNLIFIKKDFELPQDILTWDKIGYRFSPDKNRLTGVACGNDPEFTSKCNKIIEKMMIH